MSSKRIHTHLALVSDLRWKAKESPIKRPCKNVPSLRGLQNLCPLVGYLLGTHHSPSPQPVPTRITTRWNMNLLAIRSQAPRGNDGISNSDNESMDFNMGDKMLT